VGKDTLGLVEFNWLPFLSVQSKNLSTSLARSGF